MKTTMITLTGLMLVASAVFANIESHEVLDQAVHNYTNALKSDNPGVRNSALYQIVCMKNVHPEANYAPIKKVVKKMADKDDNALVRVHAKLTLLYIDDPDLSNKVRTVRGEEDIQFFQRLHNEIHKSFYSMK